MKVLIASDHAGVEIKQRLKIFLKEICKVEDLGPFSSGRVDYPDYADKLCLEISNNNLGILICGSGQGMAMRANKYKNIRAALCYNPEMAELSRQHNDANVLCLGARMQNVEELKQIIKVFLSTSFEGGRHENRVNKISRSC